MSEAIAVDAVEINDLSVLAHGFKLSLKARNRSKETIKSYIGTVEMLREFCAESGFPTTVDRIGREVIETFMADQLSRWRPKTARIRYGNLQQFFKWALDEGEISESPMRNMDPPHVPDVPVPIITDDHLKRLLKECEGKTFENRRDSAILRVFLDTGIRMGELTGLRVEDVDFELEVLIVVGKGRRPRSVPFGAKTSQSLERYARVRRAHQFARLDTWWLGAKGALGDSGVTQMIRRRCKDAGIPQLHAHLFRHTAAHQWLSMGGNETDALRLFGWKSRAMLSRYGASAADERARESFRRLAPGDRL